MTRPTSPITPGPKFVSGEISEGQFVLMRDDGSVWKVPNINNIYLTQGTVITNGDGTLSFDLPEA